jgi:hypothetical protein
LNNDSRDILSDTLSRWFTTLTGRITHQDFHDDDHRTTIEIGKCLHAIGALYNFVFPEEVIMRLFGLSLSVLQATQRKHTGEFIFIPELYNVFGILLTALINAGSGPWISQFIDQISGFYTDHDCNVQNFALTLFRAIVSKSLLDANFAATIVNNAISAISHNIRESIADHCLFLIRWMISLARAPLPDEFWCEVHGRMVELQDAPQAIDMVNRECLAALVCTWERLAEKTFIEGNLLRWVLLYIRDGHRPELDDVLLKWLAWKCQYTEVSPDAIPLLTLFCARWHRQFQTVAPQFPDVLKVILDVNPEHKTEVP